MKQSLIINLQAMLFNKSLMHDKSDKVVFKALWNNIYEKTLTFFFFSRKKQIKPLCQWFLTEYALCNNGCVHNQRRKSPFQKL